MTETATRRIRVLSNPGVWRTGDNPFLKLQLESYGDAVELIPFTWRRAFGTGYDVLHVHWLEYLVRAERPRAQAVKRMLFAGLLARLAVLRTPSVWTVHNDSPHEGSSSHIEKLLLDRWAAQVTHRVYLTASARAEAGDPAASSVIPHGHYRPVLSGPADGDGADAAPPAHPRLLHFGHIRPYKGIESLVDAFVAAWPDPSARPELEIVGRAKDPQYGSELTRRLAGVEGVTLTLAFVSDDELEALIRRSDLVVLPYTRMNNSGAALLALSVGRAILVPSSPSMRELRDELGPEWVHLFDPPFGPAALADAAAATLGRAGGEPDLSARDWPAIGAAYADLFRRLTRGRRR